MMEKKLLRKLTFYSSDVTQTHRPNIAEKLSLGSGTVCSRLKLTTFSGGQLSIVLSHPTQLSRPLTLVL